MAIYKVKTPKARIAVFQQVTHVCKAADRALAKKG